MTVNIHIFTGNFHYKKFKGQPHMWCYFVLSQKQVNNLEREHQSLIETIGDTRITPSLDVIFDHEVKFMSEQTTTHKSNHGVELESHLALLQSFCAGIGSQTKAGKLVLHTKHRSVNAVWKRHLLPFYYMSIARLGTDDSLFMQMPKTPKHLTGLANGDILKQIIETLFLIHQKNSAITFNVEWDNRKSFEFKLSSHAEDLALRRLIDSVSGHIEEGVRATKDALARLAEQSHQNTVVPFAR